MFLRANNLIKALMTRKFLTKNERKIKNREVAKTKKNPKIKLN